jgi:hypothetical protein
MGNAGRRGHYRREKLKKINIRFFSKYRAKCKLYITKTALFIVNYRKAFNGKITATT